MSIPLKTALTTAAIAALTLGGPAVAALADTDPATPATAEVVATAGDGSEEEITPTDPIPDPETDPETDPIDPVEPTPTDPAPTDPAPIDPAPTDPVAERPNGDSAAEAETPTAADTSTRTRTRGGGVGSGSPQLAATGTDLLVPGLAATALVGAGAALTFVRARRRQAAHRA